ncbi:MAG TPA: hypothetical protein VKA60_17545 [Blastocatellia bacterium]|nr:hypothetical protein [Blastocatellia bacterium]
MLQKKRHRICQRKRFFYCCRGRLLRGAEQLADGSIKALQSRLRRVVLRQNGRRRQEQEQAGEAAHMATRLPMATSRAAEAILPKPEIAPLTETAQRVVRASRHPITFIGWLSGCSLRECDPCSGSLNPTHA